jgi:hypothetical protein
MRWTSAPSPDHRLAALALAHKAVADFPGNAPLRRTLGQSLAATGQTDEAIACLTEARERFPDDQPILQALSEILARADRVDEALELASRHYAAPWAGPFAFKLLTRQGRFKEAALFEPAIAAVQPADPDLLERRAARVRHDPMALLHLCDATLDHDPIALHAIYYKAIALAQLGRADEAAALMALDRFVHVVRLPPPSDAGNDDVAAEILANPTLRPDLTGHATRNGLRTDRLPVAGDRAVVALLGTIKAQITQYAAALSGSHAFVFARPDVATFTPWALVLGTLGHQQLHIHPGRWLTGVYYVTAPGASPRPGAIRIGVLPDWAGVEPPWEVRELQPEPGTLVLFPSYVPHDTIPTGSEDDRISIAFDVAASQ